MIQLLSPLALFALLSLAIPIAIHFLNRKEGKRIKIGSLKFLESSQTNRFKSIKLNEVLLLLLRAGMLSILAFLLARPLLNNFTANTFTQISGWLLIDPILVSATANAKTTALIDSLVESGYEMHLLAKGLPEISDLQTSEQHEPAMNYWSLLREADSRLAPGLPMHVFAPKRMGTIKGERPSLSRKIIWHDLETATEKHWVEYARDIGNDSLLVAIGFSRGTSTFYRRNVFKKPGQVSVLTTTGKLTVEYHLATISGSAILKIFEGKGQAKEVAILPPSHALNVAIIHDEERHADALYVSAAVEAAAQFHSLPVNIAKKSSQENGSDLEDCDILFWLSKLPVPAFFQKKTQRPVTIIADADTKKFVTAESSFFIETDYDDSPVMLYRRAEFEQRGHAIWKNGTGQPVLDLAKQAGVSFYFFHSRFHPMWTDLVLHPVFPEWISSVIQTHAARILQSKSWDGKNDLRILSAKQILPRQSAAKNRDTHAVSRLDLHLPLWLIAAIFFAVERLFAERKNH